MAGSVVLQPVSVSVIPGEMVVTTVRIRNTGSVVDQFSVSLVGQPSAWTTVVPAVLSLFPGAEGTVDLHLAPPRAPGVGFGPVPFGVRVVASEDDEQTTVEEGEVDLRPYVDMSAKLTPRTSESKRKAHHEVVLDNRGNSAVDVEVEAGDPDELLAFEVRPRVVTIQGGQTARVAVNVAARSGFARGPDKHRPFQVVVNHGPDRPPIVLDGAMVQKASMPKFIVPLLAAVVALAVLAAVLPGLLKGKSTSSLTTADEPTTTIAPDVAPPPTEAPVDDGVATAEEAKAAAAAELAANGKDPNAPAASSGSGSTAAATPTGSGTAAATSGTTAQTSPATATTAAPSEESSSVTSPSATAAPAYAKFVGDWINTSASASPQAFRITAADGQIRLDLPTASSTPYDDANDGTINFTTTSPAERHTMSITRDGKLVDVVTTSAGASRSLVFIRR